MAEQHQFNVPYVHNPGLLLGKLPDNLFQTVKETVFHPNAKKQTSMNQRLVGVIRQEYMTPHIPGLKEYIETMYECWLNVYQIKKFPHTFSDMWTNYMRRGEFNPNHNHPGSMIAFVIWVHIPYDIKEELKYTSFTNPNYNSKNASFELIYNTMAGEMIVHPVHVDKEMEGTIIMFPGNLHHCVYPFLTSDGERISIAGNIYIDETARMV